MLSNSNKTLRRLQRAAQARLGAKAWVHQDGNFYQVFVDKVEVEGMQAVGKNSAARLRKLLNGRK